MAIHDVDVDHPDASLFYTPDLLPQPYEVRREYGWKNLHSVEVSPLGIQALKPMHTRGSPLFPALCEATRMVARKFRRLREPSGRKFAR